MVRIFGRGKGISGSAIPYDRKPTKVCDPEEVTAQICKLAKKGTTPSKIGVILRDQYGVGQIKNITGSKVVRILKTNGLAPEMPEDLYALIKKAVSIHKHLERNSADDDAKFRLIVIESRIHRLARYYRQTRRIPPTFRYRSNQAAALLMQ